MGDMESVHETESIPLTEYFPIFRVPEYSELSVPPKKCQKSQAL